MLSTLVFASCKNKNSDILDGKSFIGFEEDVYFDTPTRTFQTILTFKNDSVLVVKKLISIIDKDTLNFKLKYSNYQYKGVVKKEKNNLEFVADAYKCKGCQYSVALGKKGFAKKYMKKKLIKV